MAEVDLQDVAAASFVHGLGKRDRQAGQLNVPGFTFFSGETREFETTIPMTSVDAAMITMLKFNGVGNGQVANNWFVCPGTVFFRNSTPSYDVQAVFTRLAGGLRLLVQFYNPTGASNQTVPNITVDYKALFFDAPW